MLISIPEMLLILYGKRFPLNRGKLRVINSLWRTALGTRGTKRVATLKYGGFKVPCDISEMLQRQLYFFGTYLIEDHVLRCWEAAARSARVVFDVGANAGIYSLATLSVQADATVHAFEPTPEIAIWLRRIAQLNELEHLYVHDAAVLECEGEAILKRFRGELGNNEGMNFVSQAISDSKGEHVRTTALDQFCEDNCVEGIDLLKIDVQGQEHLVLQGATRLITDGRIRTIFMELNWAAKSEACPAAKSVQLLDEAGYCFAEPGRRLNWRKAGPWLRKLTDIVAHRETQGSK